jgi:hypothetical protein
LLIKNGPLSLVVSTLHLFRFYSETRHVRSPRPVESNAM